MLSSVKAFAFDIDGVFTDGSILALPDGDLLRTYNSKDCFGVRMAVDNGFPVAFITGGCSQSIIHRSRSLGVKDEDLYQLSKDKLPDIEHFCRRYDISLENIAYVGDDLPDIPALKAVGLSVCPSDAVLQVKSVCKYVSPFGGGKGCVRDLIEKVLTVQGKWVFDPARPWSAKHPDEITKFAELTGRNIE